MINILWDLDGTLIDSEKEVIQSLELALEKSKIDISRKIKDFVVGPTIDKIILEAFPKGMINDIILNNIINFFRDIYDNSDFEKTKPFNGIEEIIFDTTKFNHHIITNKPDFATNRILEKLNWSKYITSVSTPYTNKKILNGNKQTKGELFENVINTYSNVNSYFVGIGDMKSDCIAARENGITSFGVLWGSGTKKELTECSDFLFEDIEQLRKYLYAK